MPRKPPKRKAASVDPRVAFAVGISLALLPWGLQMIGVTLNVYLGAFVLALALAAMVYAFWIWEAPAKWHRGLRFGTVLLAVAVYASLVGYQIRRQLKPTPVGAVSTNPAPPSPQETPRQTPNPIKTLPSTTHTKRPPATQEPQPAPTTPPQESISAPNGIAIGGSAQVQNPTVNNNYGPKPGKLEVETKQVPSEEDGLIRTLVVMRVRDGQITHLTFGIQFDGEVQISNTPFGIPGGGEIAFGFLGSLKQYGNPIPNSYVYRISVPDILTEGSVLDLDVKSKTPVSVINLWILGDDSRQ